MISQDILTLSKWNIERDSLGLTNLANIYYTRKSEVKDQYYTIRSKQSMNQVTCRTDNWYILSYNEEEICKSHYIESCLAEAYAQEKDWYQATFNAKLDKIRDVTLWNEIFYAYRTGIYYYQVSEELVYEFITLEPNDDLERAYGISSVRYKDGRREPTEGVLLKQCSFKNAAETAANHYESWVKERVGETL